MRLVIFLALIGLSGCAGGSAGGPGCVFYMNEREALKTEEMESELLKTPAPVFEFIDNTDAGLVRICDG
jgi:hypothetical protein